MAASYMPEISCTFGGPKSEAVFLTHSDAPGGLNPGDVTRFLSAVSLDPSGRAAIVCGESIYTGSLLEAHLSDPSLFDGDHKQVLEKIAGNAGIIEGIVGRSIADAEIEKDVKAEDDFNDSLEAQGDFFNVVLSSMGGYGVAAVAPAGPAGAGVAGAGAFATGVASMAIKALLDGKEMEGALDAAVYRTGQDLSSSQESVVQMTQWSVEEALKRHHVDLPEQATNSLVADAVNAGWRASDSILSDHKKRPN
ncbi:hypothetical protein RKD49_005033 [Streptomyces glaucescens]